MAQKVQHLLYKCPHVKKKVSLDVEVEAEKGLLGSKIKSQNVCKCDLQSMGGCSMRIDSFDTRCPAVQLASKCQLK